MNKHQALWTAIRTTGLIFLTLSIIYLVKSAVTGTHYLYINNFQILLEALPTQTTGDAVVRASITQMLIDNTTQALLYAVAAWYFMRRGNWVHRIISH